MHSYFESVKLRFTLKCSTSPMTNSTKQNSSSILGDPKSLKERKLCVSKLGELEESINLSLAAFQTHPHNWELEIMAGYNSPKFAIFATKLHPQKNWKRLQNVKNWGIWDLQRSHYSWIYSSRAWWSQCMWFDERREIPLDNFLSLHQHSHQEK